MLRRGRRSFPLQNANLHLLNSSNHFNGDRNRITSPGMVFIRANLTNFYALEPLCITVPSCIPKYAVFAIPTKRPVSTSPGMPCSADSTSRQLFSEFLSQYLIILCAIRFSYCDSHLIPVDDHASIVSDHRTSFCLGHSHLGRVCQAIQSENVFIIPHNVHPTAPLFLP